MCEDSVTIGDDYAIAWNFELLDTNRHQLIIDGERKDMTAPVEIEDYV